MPRGNAIFFMLSAPSTCDGRAASLINPPGAWGSDFSWQPASSKLRSWGLRTATEDGTHLVPALEATVANLLLNLLDETPLPRGGG